MKLEKMNSIFGVALALSGLLMLAFDSQAQGTVNFANNVSFLTGSSGSHLVYVGSIAQGNELVGTNFRAQLYYGANADNMQSVATTGNPFRAPGTTSPGTWASPGTRTLNGFTAGDTVLLQVRVWDSATGATWEQATFRATTAPFTYVVPAAGSPANAFFMENFNGLLIPEPSSLTLGLVSLAGFVAWRRKARS